MQFFIPVVSLGVCVLSSRSAAGQPGLGRWRWRWTRWLWNTPAFTCKKLAGASCDGSNYSTKGFCCVCVCVCVSATLCHLHGAIESVCVFNRTVLLGGGKMASVLLRFLCADSIHGCQQSCVLLHPHVSIRCHCSTLLSSS